MTDKNGQVLAGRKDTCDIYAVLYEVDPTHFVPLQGDDVLRRADRLTTPTLVMHGSGDLLADLRGSRDFVRAARGAHPNADVHLRIVDGAYHELLNEPEGPGLIRDIIIWLGEH